MIKRIFAAFAVVLSMAFLASCTEKEPEQQEPVIATYYLASDVDELIQLADQRSKDVRLNVKAVETVGSESNLTFTIKADASLVEAYNTANGTDCIVLPGDCYAFDTEEVTVARYGVNSTTAVLTITAKDLEIGKNYLLPVTIGKVQGGEYKLAEAPECYVTVAASLGGSVQVDLTGLRDDACLPADASKTPDLVIKTADDMMKIPEILVDGETKYVVLDADVDMAGKSWTPINTGEGYSKGLEFNGQGHTISNFTCTTGQYRSFYGIMNGRMYDVTFENAVIDGSADGGTQPCAVIAGYGGNKTGMCEAIIYDVHVSGTVTGYKAGGAGGLVGVAVHTIVKRCSADVEIVNTNGRRSGGLVGYHNSTHEGAFLRIEDSWSAGSIFGTQNIGGIIGQTQHDNGKNANSVAASLIRNCYSTMTVTALRNVGGIASGCSYGGSYPTLELDITKDIVMNCIAWNDKLEATETTTGNYSSGAVVGYCNIYQYFIDCFRKPNLDFSCTVKDLGDITLLDQDNSSPELSLFAGTKQDETCPYLYDHAYPYHGKAAAQGVTVSVLAKALGWSEEVWDFSDDLPVLK